jgi:hypothetical protein
VSYQRGSRNPRPPDPLAFWRQYSAQVASARFPSDTDSVGCRLSVSWAFRLHGVRNYSIFPFNPLDTPWDKISLAANVSKPSRE